MELDTEEQCRTETRVHTDLGTKGFFRWGVARLSRRGFGLELTTETGGFRHIVLPQFGC